MRHGPRRRFFDGAEAARLAKGNNPQHLPQQRYFEVRWAKVGECVLFSLADGCALAGCRRRPIARHYNVPIHLRPSNSTRSTRDGLHYRTQDLSKRDPDKDSQRRSTKIYDR
jgi:hypothetical protein